MNETSISLIKEDMKVLIFGATGGIGKHVVAHAKQKGYDVTVFVRNAAKINSDDITVIEGNISNYTEVSKALQGIDAVIWCVGIPMTRKYDKMASLEGHKVLLKAMKEQGVRRLIDWGTPSTPFEKDKKSFITIVPGILAGLLMPMAKKEMVAIGNLVKESELDWTMVRFMAPKDSAYKGEVKVGFGDVKMNFAISREDIAAFMVQQVESTEHMRSMPIIGS